MELLEGANLREIIDGSGPMPPGRVIHVLSAACGALSEAHTKGMVHRDIKPGTIMLCELGGEHDVVKILDFGLVKDLSKQAPELDKVIMGTPETMAPEAVYPELMGPRADLYSLAAVGYHLLTGTPVYTAGDLREYLRLHQTKHPERPQDRLPGVPDDLSNVILRGLSKDPGMRPKNAATMRAEFLACADTGTWNAVDAAEWWSGFERPGPGDQRPASSGSESVIATALIGAETALLIDSSLFDPEGRAAQAAAEAAVEAEADRPEEPSGS
jgi:serine/threonine-protein kinase